MKPRRSAIVAAKLKRARQLLAALQSELPTGRRVSLALLDSLDNDDNGGCWIDGNRISIEARACQPRGSLLETILHEYAHAMTPDSVRDCHGSEWGINYSKCYRAAERAGFIR